MFNFDPRQYQISGAFVPEPVPDNWYKVIGRKTNIKPTRDQQNGYLNLEMEIVEGQYQGRMLFWNFNIWHSNPQTVEIAYKQLAALCAVLNRFEPWSAQGVQDNAAPILHNVPFFVRTVIAQGPSGPLNNVKDIRDQYGSEPGKPGQPSATGPMAGATPMGQPGFGQPGPAPQPATGMPQPMAQPQWGPNGQQPAAPQANPYQPQQPAGPVMPTQAPQPAWSGTPSAMPGGWGQQPAGPPPGQMAGPGQPGPGPGAAGPPPGAWGPGPAAGPPTGFPGATVPQQQPAAAPQQPPQQGWPGATPQQQPQQGWQPGAAPGGKPW